ncbi:MAG TPA: hypothetical protein VFV94_04640, partial [Polyangiaceae bacterium]|nr:hypothetical protein [Polyangiaceae bacterium]
MLRWRENKTNLRRSACLGVAFALHWVGACGGNSSRPGSDSSGTAARSGAGANVAGASASAGAGASSGAAGAAALGGGAGTGGTGTGGDLAAGTSGASLSGSAGVAMTTGGASGSGAGTAGGGGALGGAGSGASGAASAAGADPGGAGPCIDLCKPDAPVCCTEALRCMPGVPVCRLEVLADPVDPQSEYADLVEKVAALSDDIALSIGDAEIEKAAVDPEPAARLALDLTARASATHGPALENLLNHPFRIACDGEELYVGVIYIREGA